MNVKDADNSLITLGVNMSLSQIIFMLSSGALVALLYNLLFVCCFYSEWKRTILFKDNNWFISILVWLFLLFPIFTVLLLLILFSGYSIPIGDFTDTGVGCIDDCLESS